MKAGDIVIIRGPICGMGGYEDQVAAVQGRKVRLERRCRLNDGPRARYGVAKGVPVWYVREINGDELNYDFSAIQQSSLRPTNGFALWAKEHK